MKSNIIFILDRSGSMYAIYNDVIGGFNSFVTSQKEVEGEATLTLVQFNTEIETVYDHIAIQEVPELTTKTYIPNGGTALNDAIASTIDKEGVRLSKLSKAQLPDKTIVVILTDGFENSSKEYTSSDVRKRIVHQENVYNWEMVFLGANQDAFVTGGSLGFKASKIATYGATGQSMSEAYISASNLTRGLRSNEKAEDISWRTGTVKDLSEGKGG